MKIIRLILLIGTVVVMLCSCLEKKQSEYKSKVINENRLVLFKTVCKFDDLSAQFNLDLMVKRFKRKIELNDSCIVQLIISNKADNIGMDTITIGSNFYYDVVFKDCKQIVSYTKKGNKLEGMDNYYGDIIIADFNFDKKEDVAIINDSGGNGGLFYSYFLQQRNGKFLINSFLTDSIIYFPTEINIKNKTLVTYVHAGACGIAKHVYHLIKADWIEKSHTIINTCKN